MRPLALICLLLAGCGQAGDLYLPTEPPPPPESAVPPPATTPVPDDDKDRK